MNKVIISIAAALVLGASSSAAFDLKDLFNSKSGSATETTTTDESSNSGGILGAIGGFINNVTANDKFQIDDIVGTWEYTAPAVTFESESAFKKIGGAAAATAVEEKLAPYYKRLGFTRTSLVVDKDHNFTLRQGLLVLKGTAEKDEENRLVFNFNAFGTVSLGSVAANATKSGDNLNLTFDATRMIQILTKASSVINSTSLKALTSLLNSYDGIYMGYKLRKTAD